MPDGPLPSIAPSTAASVEFLGELVRAGVRDVVVCPGSRSQALALVAAEFETLGLVRVHVRIDERSAGFLALGLTHETGVPSVVITTSGTAVANLHPAVLEAHSALVPLIVVTADRPDELRGIRSNQTTTQPGIFGPLVRREFDVPAPGPETEARADYRGIARLALGAASTDPGPVHVNLSFRDPLSSAVPELSASDFAVGAPSTTEPAATARVAHPLVTVRSGPAEPRTIVIAGDKAGSIAEAVAREGEWPLVAEISSGARFGPQVVVAYRELLASEDFGGRVQRAIVFGHPTLSREVPTLLRADGVEVIVVAPHGPEFYDPGRACVRAGGVRVERDPSSPRPTREERAWAGSWVFTSRGIVAERDPDRTEEAPDGLTMSTADRRAYAKNALAAIRAPISREALVQSVWNVTWPHDRLVLGASRLIRVADGLVAGKKLRVISNRGLAGIDGTVSTALGVAVASQNAATPTAGVTRLLLGDLTLLHDVGGLLLGAGERRPRLQIVVGNDGGGTIFDGLEVASSAAPTAFDRVQFTQQSVDLEAVARAYGWDYARATTRGELDQALTAPGAGPGILEVPLSR